MTIPVIPNRGHKPTLLLYSRRSHNSEGTIFLDASKRLECKTKKEKINKVFFMQNKCTTYI